MTANTEFAKALAVAWLNSVPVFSHKLIDRGERYNGNPVFEIDAYANNSYHRVKVYRHTPLNRQHQG